MSAVATRYARALFALAKEAGSFEGVGQEIAALAAAASSAEAAAFIESPTVDAKVRQKLAAELTSKLSLSPLTGKFLGLLAERGRLGILGRVHGEYERLADRALGRVRARVRSAAPLSAAALERIRSLLAGRSGKTVVAEVSVEPEILGGVIVETQGKVYDASLATRLERMRQSLAGDQ